MKNACQYYRRCSGCTKLQFPYAKQLRDKELLVRSVLSPVLIATNAVDADLAAAVFAPIVPSPQPLAYRASTKLVLHMDTFGRRSIGLYERGTKTVVDIVPNCPVHEPRLNKLVARLFGADAPVPAPFYNHQKRSFQGGCLKFVTVRVCPVTGEAGMVLSHTGVPQEALIAWANQVAAPSGISIYATVLTKADDDQVISNAVKHIGGPENFRYRVGQAEYQLSPLAFFQANHALTGTFVEYITSELRGDMLLDLYGGFGAYSFAAISRFNRVLLVDANSHALATAAAAKAAAKLSQLEVRQASVEDFLVRMTAAERAAVTHIIVNPPRAGLSTPVKSQLDLANLPGLTELTYVSCNPETLARDLEMLTRPALPGRKNPGRAASARQLYVKSVRAFDMFPQTEHIEVVVKIGSR